MNPGKQWTALLYNYSIRKFVAVLGKHCSEYTWMKFDRYGIRRAAIFQRKEDALKVATPPLYEVIILWDGTRQLLHYEGRFERVNL